MVKFPADAPRARVIRALPLEQRQVSIDYNQYESGASSLPQALEEAESFLITPAEIQDCLRVLRIKQYQSPQSITPFEQPGRVRR